METINFIDHPGAGKLRAQSLDEYLGALIPEHPARAELAAIRAKALEGARATAQVLELLEEIKRLKAELESVTTVTVPPKSVNQFTPRNETVTQEVSNIDTKKPCPYCQRLTSTRPGPWRSHMLNKHADQVFVAP